MPIRVHATKFPAWKIWLLGIPMLVGAVLLATFFFAVFVALATLVAVVFGIRSWWRRSQRPRRAPGGSVIDGKYAVVSQRDDVKRS